MMTLCPIIAPALTIENSSIVTWVPIDSVSTTASLLIAPDLIRFVHLFSEYGSFRAKLKP
jgi:hypothetical protein